MLFNYKQAIITSIPLGEKGILSIPISLQGVKNKNKQGKHVFENNHLICIQMKILKNKHDFILFIQDGLVFAMLLYPITNISSKGDFVITIHVFVTYRINYCTSFYLRVS